MLLTKHLRHFRRMHHHCHTIYLMIATIRNASRHNLARVNLLWSIRCGRLHVTILAT